MFSSDEVGYWNDDWDADVKALLPEDATAFYISLPSPNLKNMVDTIDQIKAMENAVNEEISG